MRNKLRVFLLLFVGIFVLAASASALADETAYQLVLPAGCGGFLHEKIDGTVTGCTPNSTGQGAFGFYSVAADGSVVFQTDDGGFGSIWLVHPDGSSIELDNSGLDFSPTISYDGSKVVFARYDSADSTPQSDPSVNVSDIYGINSDGSDLHLIASGQGTQYLRVPSISPDGSTVAYWCGPGVNGDTSTQNCGPLTDGSYRNSGVMRVDFDGSNERMIVIGPGDNLQPVGPSGFTWSPDSQWLGMDGVVSVNLGPDLWTAQDQLFEYRTDGSDLFNNLDPSRQITHFVYDPNAVFPNSPQFPRFSPDGSQLLYLDFIDDNGNEGNFSYLIGVDGSDRHQVFPNGGSNYAAFIPTATPTAPPPLVDMTHITVPSVTDDTESDAASTLSSVNLTVGNVSQRYSATVPAGAVVSQSPVAGAVAHRTVKTGPPVNLVVSKGVQPPPKSLSVIRSGAGSGTVSSSPSGISCGTACSHAFTYGASVTLTATASAGSKFTGWSGACSGTAACKVTMSAAQSVTATFALTKTLTVKKTGNGSGTVASTTPGIKCGSTCSYAFVSGTKVTLTAKASSGSKFAGWSGPCSGTGVCKVTMNVARTVTATFKKTASSRRR